MSKDANINAESLLVVSFVLVDEAYRTTKADCTKTDMTAYLSKFQYGEFDPETMHLTDPRCTGQDHNQTHYAITTGYGGCRTSFNVSNLYYAMSIVTMLRVGVVVLLVVVAAAVLC